MVTSSLPSTTSVESVGSSTSTEGSSSTSSIPVANPTFSLLAGGSSPIQDGGDHLSIYIFNPTRSDIAIHTAFIDPDTGRLIFSSGYHWVAQYSSTTEIPPLILNGIDGDFTNYPDVTCALGTDLKLSCSAPAGGCDGDPLDPTCGPTSGTWDQICSSYNSIFGDVLYIFSSCPTGYTPVTLQAQII